VGRPPRWPGRGAGSSISRRAAATLGLLALGLAGAGCSNGDQDAVEFVQQPESRLIKVQSVGLAAFGPINPRAASVEDVVAAFGDPPVVDERPGRCRRRWPRLGLTIVFWNPRGGDPCEGDARVALIRVGGRAASDADWRTAEGIRPEMRVGAMRRIYPDPRPLSGGALALVDPPAEVGGGPVLVVAVDRGRVADLAFPIREREHAGRPG
jgi:hypothetical protein